MRVLLIQPSHTFDGGSRAPECIPLGLTYIGKVLQNGGHEVEILDIWLHQYSREQTIEKIKKLDYDMVGISALSTQYSYVKWLSDTLKKYNNGPIFLGGALPTFSAEVVLKNTKVDICIIGEGEVTIKEMMDNIGKLDNVEGIFFKEGNEIFKNPSRPPIKNLDEVEFPAWDLIDVEKYITLNSIGNKRKMQVVSGRGCPYNCRFCSKTFKGYRCRSVKNIIDEIKTLIDRYGINHIDFLDELVVISKKRIFELCDAIEPLNIQWSCQGRVNLVNYEILKRMKKANCVSVGYGVESGSQKILDNMNKQIRVKQSKEAIINTLNLGMTTAVQMMYGYPGETLETLDETVHFFDDLPYTGVAFLSPTTPIPGSPLYDECLKNGMIKDEVKYLESLSAGYLALYTKAVMKNTINFTSFSDEDYWRLKKDAEWRIFKHQFRRFPFYFLRRYWLKTIKYYKRWGIKKLFHRVYMALKRFASGRPA
ncbi:MAG: B12-binding domain-containing radical SAM protein [Nanoarchaeota archaeon]|nr:B12-binding domain-containing radical SAM protein [Nanoarchaeota archaeon]